MNQNGNLPTWTVTSQQEMRQQDSSGQFANGVLLGYRTSTGVNGSVFIPWTDYNVTKVRQILQERTLTHNAIKELSG